MQVRETEMQLQVLLKVWVDTERDLKHQVWVEAILVSMDMDKVDRVNLAGTWEEWVEATNNIIHMHHQISMEWWVEVEHSHQVTKCILHKIHISHKWVDIHNINRITVCMVQIKTQECHLSMEWAVEHHMVALTTNLSLLNRVVQEWVD